MPVKPRLLNDITEARIVEAFEQGLAVADAADYAGIGERTLYRWLAEGEATDDEDTPLRQLWHRVTRARATGRFELLRTIEKAASLDWRAAAWKLERTAPQHYGRQTRQSEDGADASTKGHEAAKTALPDTIPDDDLDTFIAERVRRR